ncbi:MAG: hypothetical protein LUG24_04730 [Clostridiales bacterium]|nr:hypothetical protein [Clostridiales bacterium]
MFKKITAFALTLALLLNFSAVQVFSANEYAETKLLERAEIINGVTRHDCLIGVIKAAGLQADGYFSSNYITIEKIFFDDPSYDREYLYFAEITGVIIGEENENAPTWLNCRPNDTATVKECVGFMMRVVDSEAEGKTDDELYERAKLQGLVKFEDSFYFDPEEDLSYDKYYTLICRMLNEKRYLYFAFNDNMDPLAWVNSYYKDFVKYDENGEMTYIEYLSPYCEIEESSDEETALNKVIKKLNIINVSKLNCLTAVTKTAGMRVEGLFEGSDTCASIMEKTGLSEEWVKYVKDYGFQTWNTPDYGIETTIFSMIYGLLPDDEPEKEKTYHDYTYEHSILFSERASVKDCVSYILWFLTDMPEDITSEEMYALAVETGLVEEADNVYEDWENRIDYNYFLTLLHRMLNTERYIYFEEETEDSRFDAKRYDEAGEMTYYDCLTEICG